MIADLNAELGPELNAAATTKEVMEVIKPKGKWAIRWYEDGLDEGRAEGIEQGIRQQKRLVRRLVVRRFGADIADRMVPTLDQLSDPERISAIADAIFDCETSEEFVARTTSN